MIKKSISVTAKQDSWIKAQVKAGHFGDESEVVRELILERQAQERETPAGVEAIRKALIDGEQSGFTDNTVDEIWAEARKRNRAKHA